MFVCMYYTQMYEYTCIYKNLHIYVYIQIFLYAVQLVTHYSRHNQVIYSLFMPLLAEKLMMIADLSE